MKLYMTERSGNAYKPRLLLALLDVPYEKALLDFPNKEHKQEPFLKLNRRGQVPVLEDDGHVYWGSTACLVYIARKHGGEQWLPIEPAPMAEVMQWLELAENEIHYGLQWARRLMNRVVTEGNLDEYQTHGRTALTVLEGRLKDNQWLALGRPTIADIACYPYVAACEQGGMELSKYASVQQWINRIETELLPSGFARYT